MTERGPGHTQYLPNRMGGIDAQIWNDPSWRSIFAEAYKLRTPVQICALLRQAYDQGFEDRAVVIRRAIGEAGTFG